jgi:hypothetical protein
MRRRMVGRMRGSKQQALNDKSEEVEEKRGERWKENPPLGGD